MTQVGTGCQLDPGLRRDDAWWVSSPPVEGWLKAGVVFYLPPPPCGFPSPKGRNMGGIIPLHRAPQNCKILWVIIEGGDHGVVGRVKIDSCENCKGAHTPG